MTTVETDVWLDYEVAAPVQCERGKWATAVPKPPLCSNTAEVEVTITCMACNKTDSVRLCWRCYSLLADIRRGTCRTYRRGAAIFINSVEAL